MAEDTAPYALVVIGSSAGGIEALRAVVAALRPGFPVPIVIAQHLDPSHPSHLAEILAHQDTLPVRTVTDRARLEPGVIFVVPSDRHVEIRDHQLMLHRDGGSHPQPSVDLLFSSAARAYGEALIAVVLTGTGSDGAAGAREVKQAGGTVIIQNPDTAAFPGMPESLAPTTVDIVADLERIGALLSDLVNGAALPAPPEEDRTLAYLLEDLREQSGIDFSSYKTSTITRRLQRRLVAAGSENLDSYIRYLRDHPEEYQRLVSGFLIKVTEFFRDPELYAEIREEIMPQLVASARRRGNELRLWSAGCATGEEAYSLAIVLAEVLGDELDRFNVRIFATDLDTDAVAFARRGIYPAAALANLSPELVSRHFSDLGGEYEIKKRLRGLIVFGQHDLGQRPPFPRVDLVLCRNVLIYFTSALQKRALQLFAFSLRDGGYLVLGKTETTTPLGEFFTLEQPLLRIYRRHGERLLIPPTRLRNAKPAIASLQPIRERPAAPVETGRAPREAPHRTTSTERLAAILLGLPAGVVLVDRQYDILAINSAARLLLGIHTTAIGEDLIHLARSVPSEWLRNAIDTAFRSGAPSAEDLVAIEDPTGGSFHYRITCTPHRFDDQESQTERVLIVVTDVSDLVGARQESEIALAGEHAESVRYQQEAAQLSTALQRLAATNRQLLEANQSLTAANAELRGAHEELLVTNEEAQAASEEVETLNEELQATNEELETLNEELQATVEELNTTNDDLHARSTELHELADSLDTQRRESEIARVRLQTVLHELGDAVLVVDRNGQPVLTNRAYIELFGGERAPIAAEDGDGKPLPPEATPQRRAAQPEPFRMEFSAVAPDGSRRWFEAHGQPVREDGGTHLGVVVIRDITERSLRLLQEQFVAMASHELRTPLTALQLAIGQMKRVSSSAEQPETSRWIEMALTQVHRLDRLTADLADVTRLQTGRLRLQRQPLDLVALVRRTVEVMQEMHSDRTLDLAASPDALQIDGDATRLEQVLTNLLRNAVVHAPASERIEVRVEQEGNQAVLEVRDYGPGIPAEFMQEIFSPFFQALHRDTAQAGGLGLGLFSAQGLVEAHGGMIAVQSTEGEGTTFTIRLPLAPAETLRASR